MFRADFSADGKLLLAIVSTSANTMFRNENVHFFKKFYGFQIEMFKVKKKIVIYIYI